MKQYEVIVSDNSIKMLREHLGFASNLGKAAAHRINIEIFEAIYSLASMPERCPFISDDLLPANRYRKLYVKKWYLILFQIQEGVVYVDYIIDCRQDNSWLRI